jgi:hypothetical protein
MKRIAGVLICFLVVSCFAQTEKPNTTPSALEQALSGHSKAFAEALKKKDVTSLKRALTEDFVEVWSDGKLHDRSELLDAAQQGTVKEFRPYDMHVLPVSETSAIVTYDCIVQMPEGDTDMAPRYQHISDLWVKQGDEWRLKFQQWTPARPID